MFKNFARALFPITIATFTLTACGGGGGGGGAGGSGLVSTPTPPAAPPPAPSVQLFASPATQQFTTFSAAAGPTSMAVHYDSPTNLYEVSLDGADWQRLLATDNEAYVKVGTNDVEAPSLSLVPAGAFTAVRTGTSVAGGKVAEFAVGIATPANAVPLSGNATYNGSLHGRSDVGMSISGSIMLAFDFASGGLSGSIHPILDDGDGWGTQYPQDLGVYAFADTVHAAGATTFEGRFSTALAGANAFHGQFMGSSAQETLGDFRFPFLWTSSFYGDHDGKTHSAWGVFAARR